VTEAPGDGPSGRGEGEREQTPSEVAGRRTLGPAPRPGRRYSIVVGMIFLALVIVGLLNNLASRDDVLGLDKETKQLPLPEFAVPVAASELEGDANIAQDDCESARVPCPRADRRTPACRVNGPDVIRVCDLFDRPLVISFWFTRGGNCEAQQNVVSGVSQRYRGRVNFLSIDVRDGRDQVRDLIRERDWKMPVGYDHDGALASIYRIGGCPTFVFAYPGGILERATIGELDAAALSRRVQQLIRTSRAKARASR
jgi:thiol-disulfide isomerase/thioredoxin